MKNKTRKNAHMQNMIIKIMPVFIRNIHIYKNSIGFFRRKDQNTFKKTLLLYIPTKFERNSK